MRSLKPHSVFVGTAGWSIPKPFADLFSGSEGSHLERYARNCSGVEINSSFYRDHQLKTYVRWAESVPPEFRFSVKLSKEITHVAKLRVNRSVLSEKIDPIRGLREKLGVLLVQLPPSLAFEPELIASFFRPLRFEFDGPVAIEPRHPSWTDERAQECLRKFSISKVIADPERCPIEAMDVLTAGSFFYFRLHGSPVLYESDYPVEVLDELASTIVAARVSFPGWCIFDNTKYGFATKNALALETRLFHLREPLGMSRNQL